MQVGSSLPSGIGAEGVVTVRPFATAPNAFGPLVPATATGQVMLRQTLGAGGPGRTDGTSWRRMYSYVPVGLRRSSAAASGARASEPTRATSERVVGVVAKSMAAG